MIQSKSDLSFYIREDNKQYFENKCLLKRWGGDNERCYLIE